MQAGLTFRDFWQSRISRVLIPMNSFVLQGIYPILLILISTIATFPCYSLNYIVRIKYMYYILTFGIVYFSSFVLFNPLVVMCWFLQTLFCLLFGWEALKYIHSQTANQKTQKGEHYDIFFCLLLRSTCFSPLANFGSLGFIYILRIDLAPNPHHSKP